MRPVDLIAAVRRIEQQWPDALIYPNACCPGRNPGLPDNALAIDVDRVWPHNCDDNDDCTGCYGGYRLTAWIDILGLIHYVDPIDGTTIDVLSEWPYRGDISIHQGKGDRYGA